MKGILNNRIRGISSGRFRWLSGWGSLRWSAILMVIAILAITGFQLYWLKNNYDREKQNLAITTNSYFRQTIFRLQAAKLKLDALSFGFDSSRAPIMAPGDTNRRERPRTWRRDPSITVLSLLQEKMKDSMRWQKGPSATRMNSRDRERNDYYFDSSGNKLHRRSVTISQSVDSLGINPEMIRRIDVRKDRNSPDTVIAIEYGEKFPSAKKEGPPEFQGKSEILIEGRSSGLWDQEIQSRRGISFPPRNSTVFRFLYNLDSLATKDSVTVKEVTDAYATRLNDENIDVSFSVNRQDSADMDARNMVTIGFAKPTTFVLTLQSTINYMLNKLKLPILFSLLLVGITVASFVLLYRNMIKQQRLAELKNDFISNVTHELKTPIATVGVAIEALKNFNAIDDAARTREYLDISQNELQRLNLLVDKVLKLSIFEKKEIELRKERFDCKQLASEIINSMRLQFEKSKAVLNLETEGEDFSIEADKLHITSVLYNLLDNALKYSTENPVITVALKSYPEQIEISVRDNGMGIPPAYKTKVFEKFFRVPTGNKHNIKGYGLGLSYVAEVIKRHHGSIIVESNEGEGSIFTVLIPRQATQTPQ